MALSFLIATLVLFSLNLMVNLFSIGREQQEHGAPTVASVISVIATLIMLSWNILALINY